MTERTHPTALLSPPVIDAARIPSTRPGVASHREQIAAVAAAIAQAFHPERIVLFGSRAYGTPHPDSDVDLMVVMDTPLNLFAQATRIRRDVAVDPAFRLQVLVRRPDDIALRLAEGDFFVEDVMLKGITLYAREGMDKPPSELRPVDNPDDDGSRLKIATQDWLRQADKDAESGRFLLTAPAPDLNLVCFLAQQSAEKALKGLLEQHDTRFPRTHDLVALAALARPLVPDLAAHTDALKALTICAVDARYLGIEIDADEVDAALRTMTTVRDLVQAGLGPDEEPKPGSHSLP